VTKRRRRITANPAQLRTELCAELKSLCESFAADGRLVLAEIEGLRTWLRDSAGVDLPQDLRNVVSRVIVTGELTADERRAIYGTLEVVEAAESSAAVAAVASLLSGAPARRPWAFFVGVVGLAALALMLTYR